MDTLTFTETALTDAAWEAGLDAEADLNLTYSGRGMMGESCVGVVTDDERQAFSFLLRLVTQHLGHFTGYAPDEAVPVAELCGVFAEVMERLPVTRSDSLGRSTIWYWPELTWDGNGEAVTR